VALVPNGKHIFPLRPDGTRDIDLNHKITDTWKELEALVSESGRGARSIGLSNASEAVVEKVLEHATIKPAVDQVTCCLLHLLRCG
jgi:diketogulonate reductase-like aldo/keto reductase